MSKKQAVQAVVYVQVVQLVRFDKDAEQVHKALLVVIVLPALQELQYEELSHVRQFAIIEHKAQLPPDI